MTEIGKEFAQLADVAKSWARARWPHSHAERQAAEEAYCAALTFGVSPLPDDVAGLNKKLRTLAGRVDLLSLIGPGVRSITQAADLIEAQARQIAELEEQIQLDAAGEDV